MKRVAWWMVVLLAGGLARAAAEACTCGKQAPVVRPGPTDEAPLDTHVWVHGDDGRFADLKPTEPAETLRLRLAGGKDVPITIRYLVSDEASVAELIPSKLLAPGKTYQVVASTPGSAAVTDHVIGSFQTGSAADLAPPSFKGVTRSLFVRRTGKLEVVTIAGKKVIRILQGGCDRESPAYALVEVATASDDVTPVQGMGYGLWPAGSQDLSAPPLTVLIAEAPAAESNLGTPTTRLRLGAGSSCDTSGYDFATALAKLPKPRKKKAPRPFLIHFTMAAIDLSGKRSAPVDLAIDLANPVQSEP